MILGGVVMVKKLKCPSCGAIIDVGESQERLHCDGCGKNYKNPYKKVVDCEEVQKGDIAGNQTYTDAREDISVGETVASNETIEQDTHAVSEINGVETEKREKAKKTFAKSTVAMIVLASFVMLFCAVSFAMALLWNIIGFVLISLSALLVGTACFVACIVLCKTRNTIGARSKTCLLIVLISSCISVIGYILSFIVNAEGRMHNVVIISWVYTWLNLHVIALLVLSAVNLKNIKPFIPQYVVPAHNDGHSEFNAGLLSLIWLNFVNGLIITFTLGFGTPWTVRREYTWLYEHQVIDDRKLVFEGKAASLFGQWVKWILLSVVTVGVYAFVVPIKKMQWITKNTHIQGSSASSQENTSEFDGKFWSFFGMRFVNALIVVFSLGICTPWAIVREQRWLAEHRVFDGQRLVFDGSAVGFVGQWIKWLLLSIITLGIYALWIPVKKQKWITAHTHFAI